MPPARVNKVKKAHELLTQASEILSAVLVEEQETIDVDYIDSAVDLLDSAVDEVASALSSLEDVIPRHL